MVEQAESWNRQKDGNMELFEAPKKIKDTTGNSCKVGQEKAKNETIALAEKPNYNLALQLLNNVNQVMNISNNNHDHDDITSGTPKEKIAKTSKPQRGNKVKTLKKKKHSTGSMTKQNREKSKPCKPLQWLK
ncbi:Inhibitor of growth protein 1 [Sciurus carolinensis]|uniref:Inhibitor of growth protein 1 n=1 Tax=Sciurus carolinensis TaxID=30640 RepID=A0AA41N476_SCICA|nr:Inhibitor of growth protein 1 [Sciurus carolinensis]